jgi:hypothetical protein
MKKPIYGNRNPSRKLHKTGDMVEIAAPPLYPIAEGDDKRLDQNQKPIRQKRKGEAYRMLDYTPVFKHMDLLSMDTVQVVGGYWNETRYTS